MGNDRQAILKSNRTNLVRVSTKKICKAVKRHSNANRVLGGVTIVGAIAMLLVAGQFIFVQNKLDANIISDGVVINGAVIGGLNQVVAEKVLTDMFEQKAQEFDLTIRYGDECWNFTHNDFIVNSDVFTIIEEANKRNRLVSSYDLSRQELSKLKEQNSDIQVAFNYIFVGLDEKIKGVIKDIEVEPIDSQINFNASSNIPFEITQDVDGVAVDFEKLYNDINNQFITGNVIDVVLSTIPKTANVTILDNHNKTKLISSYTTYVEDSTGNRKFNVSKAIKCFNGLVIEPNQTISFNDQTGPHTIANGYKSATIILNGKYVDGEGGGVCQASTTLYNALLLADIQIDEVFKHTIPVKYVPLAMDAMVSDSYADLKFTNNVQTEIYILTKYDSKSITVNIYGVEPDYEIVMRSETLNEIECDNDDCIDDIDGEYIDKVLFIGESFRLTYPRKGYEVKTYKDYYLSGELIESKEIRYEYYKPKNGVVINGCIEPPAGLDIIDEPIQSTANLNDLSLSDALESSICP